MGGGTRATISIVVAYVFIFILFQGRIAASAEANQDCDFKIETKKEGRAGLDVYSVSFSDGTPVPIVVESQRPQKDVIQCYGDEIFILEKARWESYTKGDIPRFLVVNAKTKKVEEVFKRRSPGYVSPDRSLIALNSPLGLLVFNRSKNSYLKVFPGYDKQEFSPKKLAALEAKADEGQWEEAPDPIQWDTDSDRFWFGDRETTGWGTLCYVRVRERKGGCSTAPFHGLDSYSISPKGNLAAFVTMNRLHIQVVDTISGRLANLASIPPGKPVKIQWESDESLTYMLFGGKEFDPSTKKTIERAKVLSALANSAQKWKWEW